MHFLKIVLKLSDFKAQMGAKIVGFHFKGIFLIDPPLKMPQLAPPPLKKWQLREGRFQILYHLIPWGG